MAVRVGLTFQPERTYLDLLAPLLRDRADYVEVAPETLWRSDASGAPIPNAFHERLVALRAETGRPVVAHGTGLSLGTVSDADDARRAAWLERIAADHAVLDFAWYTDHLGATVLDDRNLTLPQPVPMTDAMVAIIQARLRALQAIVPDVGLENSVFYHVLGDPLEEPAFLARILQPPGMHLLLDLHNVYTMAVNHGFDARVYLDRVDTTQVIEIHVAGGTQSQPGWLPNGRTLRLDSHCSAVPAEVWALLEETVPRCPNLRGVTLERMEGTVTAGDVDALRAELDRLHDLVERAA